MRKSLITKVNPNNTVLITYSQAIERYNLGRNKVYDLAKEADAIIKIGKSARIDMKKMDEFVLSFKG